MAGVKEALIWTNFALGFVAKLVTGLDDTITHIPVLGAIAKTRMGRIAFGVGQLLAVVLAIVVADVLAQFISGFVYYKYIVVGLLWTLAFMIYMDLFVMKPKKKMKTELVKSMYKHISTRRFFTLLGVGFASSIVTVLDDIIVFIPLLSNGFDVALQVSAGIILATLCEIYAIIYCSRQIKKIPYKEEIASVTLLVFGFLILGGVL